MNIYESAENYLETILSLHETQGLVRSIDIANHLHFSKPSVSVAMKKLRESGYIEMDKEGFISLLPAGEEIARRIYERHKLLTRFFIHLGVSPEVAAADACKIEHDLSEETFQKIKEHAMGGMPEA
ncbi:metal-dependent transcriptional regulator [Flavonifractor sp. HCP28S3_F3]|uniref:metal-dependent transcriptional regulator n=1 Tax=Flavonifractor sp. HCP28S3_F3 TaxID=3438939 RepID=UPI003F89F315